jgi:hypothetical protein
MRLLPYGLQIDAYLALSLHFCLPADGLRRYKKPLVASKTNRKRRWGRPQPSVGPRLTTISLPATMKKVATF